MAQVGADDDQSPIAVPERFRDLGHRLGVGPVDQIDWGSRSLPSEERVATEERLILRTMTSNLVENSLGNNDRQVTSAKKTKETDLAQEAQRRRVHDTSQDHVELPRSTPLPSPEKGPPGLDPGRG